MTPVCQTRSSHCAHIGASTWQRRFRGIALRMSVRVKNWKWYVFFSLTYRFSSFYFFPQITYNPDCSLQQQLLEQSPRGIWMKIDGRVNLVMHERYEEGLNRQCFVAHQPRTSRGSFTMMRRSSLMITRRRFRRSVLPGRVSERECYVFL